MTHNSDLDRRKMQANLAMRVLVALMAVTLVAVVALFSTLALLNRQTLTSITDCTQPGGHCYQRGQKQTAKVVVGIQDSTLRVVTAVAGCQSRDRDASPAQLRQCAIRILQRAEKSAGKR